MGITHPSTGIHWRAANRSGLVSTKNLNEANSRTVNQALVLPMGVFEACARILLVMNKERRISDIL
jgi:hypothetical protein